MKQLYSIGEMAAICGVSVQTLRYYSTLGLIAPEHVDEKTGYRYYLSDSIPMIDRVKYLQGFGISLADIKKIVKEGNADTILYYLIKQREKAFETLRLTERMIDEIGWYIDYFDLSKEDRLLSIPYKKRIEKRYALMVDRLPNESLRNAYIRLLDVRNSPEFRQTVYRFQFTYSLDFDDLAAKRFAPRTIGLFLGENFPEGSEYVYELPEGEYLCFRGRLRTGDWDARHVLNLFDGSDKPQLVLANEHEYNFIDYEDSIFEVQIFLK